jgi:hypothetical protein
MRRLLLCALALMCASAPAARAANALPAHCRQAAPSLFSQLAATGRSWRDWQESMPAPCNFNLIVPNDCENGHDPCGGDGVRHFDRFLAREVPRIEASPACRRSFARAAPRRSPGSGAEPVVGLRHGQAP